MGTKINDPVSVVYELNRDLFIKWTTGILLDRNKDGKCLILDGSDFEAKCLLAERALESGGTIYLTDGRGNRITKMYASGEGYVEEEV